MTFIGAHTDDRIGRRVPRSAPSGVWVSLRRRGAAGMFLLLALLLAGCGGAAGPRATSARCEAVSAAKLAGIAEGLTDGGTLSNGYAVKSTAYEQVWMVAARIDSLGRDVGVWATNDLTAGQGLIFAVDGIAREFSDWGHGPGQMSVTDDGVTEATGCASA